MPSKSKRQERAMRAACHNASAAGGMGIPQDVACEYAAADKRKRRKR